MERGRGMALTPVDTVAAAKPLPAGPDLLHVGTVVRCKVDERVFSEAEVVQSREDTTWGRGRGSAGHAYFLSVTHHSPASDSQHSHHPASVTQPFPPPHFRHSLDMPLPH